MLGREYDARGVDCASDLGGCALGTEKRSRIARDPFQLPALELIESDRGYVSRSLQHEVIAECLRRADDALYAPEPGAALAVLGGAEDIVKAAATTPEHEPFHKEREL